MPDISCGLGKLLGWRVDSGPSAPGEYQPPSPKQADCSWKEGFDLEDSWGCGRDTQKPEGKQTWGAAQTSIVGVHTEPLWATPVLDHSARHDGNDAEQTSTGRGHGAEEPLVGDTGSERVMAALPAVSSACASPRRVGPEHPDCCSGRMVKLTPFSSHSLSLEHFFQVL